MTLAQAKQQCLIDASNADDDVLVVEVVDDGRGAAALVQSPPGGQGLTGVEERARLHGGRAVAGPRDGGGYRVRAELPA